jgi:hypothetical protein
MLDRVTARSDQAHAKVELPRGMRWEEWILHTWREQPERVCREGDKAAWVAIYKESKK